MSKSSTGKYKKLIMDGKEYLTTRYDLLRLELLEKTSSIVALLILVMITLVLGITVWVYISSILIVLMANTFGSYIPPLIIMGGVSLLMLVMVVLMKDKIILNPLIRIFSKILFNNTEDNNEDENDENSNDDE